MVVYNINMSSFDPAVYNEKYENGYVENRDFEPFIIKNIITLEDIEDIYNIINDTKEFLFQEFVGHRAYTFKHDAIVNKITEQLNKKMNEEMILKEYSFARYSPNFGYKPKLFPHYDTHFLDGQRITIDIQMNKNIEWPVVVEGKSFIFDKGDALVFSGTQQIHWRENIELKKDDEVDMIFAHFAYKNEKPWSPMQKEILEYKSHRLRESLKFSNQPEKIDFGV